MAPWKGALMVMKARENGIEQNGGMGAGVEMISKSLNTNRAKAEYTVRLAFWGCSDVRHCGRMWKNVVATSRQWCGRPSLM